MDLEPESSPAGLSAVSGDKPAGVGLGGLLVKGKTIGASAGVAELAGTVAEVPGVCAAVGLPGISGPETGAKEGAATGGTDGEETEGDGVAGVKTGGDALGDGVETVGDDGGGVEAEGEDLDGEVAGATGGVEDGDLTGEDDGERCDDFEGEGAGALPASTTKIEMHKANRTTRKSLGIISPAFMVLKI